MFLCEAAANQLQQLKGCCGVSHVIGFVQKSKPRNAGSDITSHLILKSQQTAALPQIARYLYGN